MKFSWFLALRYLKPKRTFISIITGISVLGGSSGKTVLTVDGGNVRNPLEGGSAQNFSQEVVEEFQISTANFDRSQWPTPAHEPRSNHPEALAPGYLLLRR